MLIFYLFFFFFHAVLVAFRSDHVDVKQVSPYHN